MPLKLAKLAKKQESRSPIEWLTTSELRQESPLLQREVGYSDATNLDPTDEDTFLQNLKVRFLNKQIYVSCQ